MATADEISAFRLTIGEPDETTYSDSLLSDRIDVADDLNALAATIWREKAATYAKLVDMQEGTSRRTLSQLQSQALAMATAFSSASDGSGATAVGHKTRTRPIERV